MRSPCWGCARRVATPNCHGTCKDYATFSAGVAARREARNGESRAKADLVAARQSFWRISKEIRDRAKGD